MTLLRPGMTARYTSPDGTVYELIISKDAKPETPDEGKKVDGGLDATQPPDSGAA
jgi:hypothetical protein